MKQWLLEKKWRTILGGISIATLPLIVLSLYIYQQIASALEDRLLKENQRLALFTAHAIEEKLRSEISYAKAFASRYLLQEGIARNDREEMRRHLKTLVETSHVIERAFVTDVKGVQLANYPYTRETVGKDFSSRDWYQGIAKNWQSYVSEFYLRAAMPRRNVFAVAIPMQYLGKVVGALVMQPRDDFVKNVISERDDSEAFRDPIRSGYIYVVDSKGCLIYHPQDRIRELEK